MTSTNLRYVTSSWILGAEPKFAILVLQFCPHFYEHSHLSSVSWTHKELWSCCS